MPKSFVVQAASPDASACFSSAFQSGSPVDVPAARTVLLSGAPAMMPGSRLRVRRSSANPAMFAYRYGVDEPMPGRSTPIRRMSWFSA